MDARNGDNFPVHYDGPSGGLEPYGRYRYPGVAQESESADVSRLLSIVREKVWWVAAAMVIGGMLGFLYSRQTTVTFKTTSTVWLERPNYQSGPIIPGMAMRDQGWAGLLLSNAVLEPVARQLRLHASLQSPGPPEILDGLEIRDDLVPGRYQLHLTGNGGYQLLNLEGSVLEEGTLAAGVGRSRGFIWMPDEAAIRALPEEPIFRVSFPHQAANRLQNSLSVRYDDLAGMIFTEFRAPNPRMGVAIHNAIIESFLERASDLTSAQLNEEVALLEQQAETTQARLGNAERELSQFMVQSITQPGQDQLNPSPIMALPGGGGASVSNPQYAGFFQQQTDLDRIRTDVAEFDRILNDANGGKINLLDLRLVPSIADQPAIGNLISSIEANEVQIETLLYTYTTDYPEVVELNRQIRDQYTRQLPALIRDLQDNLRKRATTLQSQIQQRADQLEAIPERNIQQARLERQKSLAEQLHTSLLGRLNSARLAADTRPSPIQRLDRAVMPGGPESQTTPPFFILVGALAGMGLGIGAVILRDRLDKRIRHPDDIAGKFGLPLLGVVPQLEVTAHEGQAAVAVESFRSIRTQLAHAHGEMGGGPVLITSSTPREGKSVVAANLAISYASSGLRTLLVDADIRRGRLHSVFHFPRSPGLTEHLMGHASMEDVIRHDDGTGLDVVCSGALSANAELIGGEPLDAFLANVRDAYDVVVLDGPPLAAGADALILGQRCDKVVMVFRAGATSENMARTRLGMLGNVDLPIVGAVLNAVPEHAPYYDQYVNYYYYAEAEAS